MIINIQSVKFSILLWIDESINIDCGLAKIGIWGGDILLLFKAH